MENKFASIEKKKNPSPIAMSLGSTNVSRDTNTTTFDDKNATNQGSSISAEKEISLPLSSIEKNPKCGLEAIKKQNNKSGKTQIAYYIDSSIYKNMKRFAAIYEVKLQDMVNQALKEFIEKYDVDNEIS